MKKCEKCWKEFDDAYFYCPYCGKRYKDKKEKKKKEIIQVILIFLIGILMWSVFFYFLFLYDPSENSPEASYDKKIEEKEQLNQKNAKTVDIMVETFEELGYLCWTDGYTFDKCTNAARSYLYDHYGEGFHYTCAFVYTEDLVKTYYVSGYTNSGRNFVVTIIHQDDKSPQWKVTDAIVYKNE